MTPIDLLADRTFGFLRHLTLWGALRLFFGKKHRQFLYRSEFTKEETCNADFALLRSRWVDGYVLLWIVSGTIIFSIVCITSVSPGIRYFLLGLAAMRLLETFQSPLNTLVFDYARGRTDGRTASSSRLLVLSIVNVAELALWFAIVYALNVHLLCGATARADSLYFSVLTQFTVGYGDIHPIGILRTIAAIQVFCGFILSVLVLARAVSSLPHVAGLLDPPSSGPCP